MGSIDLRLPRLEDYDIDPQLGFVAPDSCSLQSLNSYYEAWNVIVSRLSSLIASKRLRPAVRELPVLKLDRLESEAERRRAYVTLGSLVQAYVFEDLEQPDPVVPASISEPFLEICAYWGLSPILSYIGYCLWNWKLDSAAGFQSSRSTIEVCEIKKVILQGLHSLESCASFTSTQDEKAFSMVPILVEAEGGCLIAEFLEAIRAANVGDIPPVIACFESCTEKLAAMSRYLHVLHEQCAPQVFYDQVRPLIAGSRGLKTENGPCGMIFELSDGQRIASERIGATAGQSSLFQFLDHVLGVEHGSDLLQEMRLYMPRKHREFLQVIEQLPNLRQFVKAHSEHQELLASFDRCIEQLRTWRSKHISVVTRYVMMPAKRDDKQGGVKGTGGSLPIPFLKVVRDETIGV